MQKYSYVVKDGNGTTLKGNINAESRERVIFALQNKGYIILEVREGTGGTLFGKTAGAKKVGGKVPGHVLAFFAEQLSTLIAGGVPLVRAVSLLSEYASNPKLGVVLNQVAKDISAGNSFHSALARHPKTFDNIWLSLVQAGEVGGNLADTLGQISQYIKTQEGKGMRRALVRDDCEECYSVRRFAEEHPKGRYLLALDGHVVAVVDGHYFDTWDSGDEVPVYYWYKEE